MNVNMNMPTPMIHMTLADLIAVVSESVRREMQKAATKAMADAGVQAPLDSGARARRADAMRQARRRQRLKEATMKQSSSEAQQEVMKEETSQVMPVTCHVMNHVTGVTDHVTTVTNHVISVTCHGEQDPAPRPLPSPHPLPPQTPLSPAPLPTPTPVEGAHVHVREEGALVLSLEEPGSLTASTETRTVIASMDLGAGPDSALCAAADSSASATPAPATSATAMPATDNVALAEPMMQQYPAAGVDADGCDDIDLGAGGGAAHGCLGHGAAMSGVTLQEITAVIAAEARRVREAEQAAEREAEARRREAEQLAQEARREKQEAERRQQEEAQAAQAEMWCLAAPQITRLTAIFHRTKSTLHSGEERAFLQVSIEEPDLAVLEAYYAAHWPPQKHKNYLRHDLRTLLEHYPQEVDRARTWQQQEQQRQEPPPVVPKVKRGFFAGTALEGRMV